jgi:hypothetical protein
MVAIAWVSVPAAVHMETMHSAANNPAKPLIWLAFISAPRLQSVRKGPAL